MKKIAQIVLLTALSLSANKLSIHDFAFGVEVEGSANGSELTFELPVHFYQNIRTLDGDDSRMFNESGHQLPLSFVRQKSSETTYNSTVKPLALFPIVNRGMVTPQTMAKVTASLSSGTTVTVVENGSKKPGSTPSAYVLENRHKASGSLQSLEFSWKQFDKSLILPLRIESSHDLESWKTVSSRETISRLIFQGEKIERSSVSIPATSARYIRVTPDQREGLVTLTSVSGRYGKSKTIKKEQTWITLENAVADTVPGSYIINTGGAIPFNAIRFEAPVSGMLYRGTLSYRDNDSANWRRFRDFTHYDIISGGDTLKSERFYTGLQRHPQWKLQFSTPLDIDESLLPKVSIALVPENVEFLARGEGPFVFAYGNDTLNRSSQTYSPMRKCEKVGITAPRNLGGGDVAILEEEAPIVPTKNIVLWSVLLIGVVLVTGMAISLSRELKQTKGENNE